MLRHIVLATSITFVTACGGDRPAEPVASAGARDGAPVASPPDAVPPTFSANGNLPVATDCEDLNPGPDADRSLKEINAYMECRAQAYDAAEWKPIVLEGLTCGDNCYVDYAAMLEGTAEAQALCVAPECDAWIAAGELPSERRGTQVEARFGTGEQTDAAGNVMSTDFPAIMAFRFQEDAPAGLSASSANGEGSLPLRTGVYVLEATPCDPPASAAFRVYDGGGLSGSATRDCRATVQSVNNSRHVIENDCENTYDGSRTTETLTVAIASDTRFALDGGAGDPQVFRLCPSLMLSDYTAQ